MVKKRAYLCLGSNLGDRRAYLERALEAMHTYGIEVLRVSAFYESQPVPPSGSAQPWFLNCVAEVETECMPLQLLHRLQRIEKQLGRRRSRSGAPRGPRTIDIDILLYANHIMETEELTIPHPRMAERRFVLEPLRELAAGLRHPVSRRTVAELLAGVPDRSRVHRFREQPPC